MNYHSTKFVDMVTNKSKSKDIEGYLENKHITIKNNYKTPDGKYSESCSLIAFEVARILLNAGKEPYVATIHENIENNGIMQTKSLLPLIYGGEVSRGAHHICCSDGEAFDPIIGQKISIEQYCEHVFGEQIKMETTFSKERTKEIVKKYFM